MKRWITKLPTGKTIGWNKASSLRPMQVGNYLNFRMEGLERTLGQLEELKRRGTDLSDVLIDTVETFKENMRADFRAHISPDTPPIRWRQLSKEYAVKKFKAIGKRIADLVYTGRLKMAVDGGPGWTQTITNTRAEFGIVGIPYAAAHQFGYAPRKLPARPYFLAQGNRFPQRIINYLVSRIEAEITRGM